MKTFKKILIAIAAVILVLVVVAFFLPREIHVERSGSVNAPAKVVFNQVNNLRTWDKWAVWNQMDPDMKIEYENSGIGKNAAYTWESENPNLGKGKMTITESVPYDSIATEMDFMEEGTSAGYFLFDENNGVTEVTWGFDTNVGNNPVARWMGLMFDSMLGSDFEKSLENLKVVSETIVRENRPIVEIVSLSEFNYISMRGNIKLEEISDQMGMMYGKLMEVASKNGLSMTNMPYAIYHKIDGGLIDLECGIPVDKLIDATGNIMAGTTTEQTCASADHIGPYTNLEKTHGFIQNWIQDNGFSLAGSPMERYLTDPQQEPDESKWATAIYYPVQ
jgi:effector-binding domain-containing protein